LESSEATFEYGRGSFRPNLTDDYIKEFNVEANDTGEVKIVIFNCNENQKSSEIHNETLSPARLKFDNEYEHKSSYRAGIA